MWATGTCGEANLAGSADHARARSRSHNATSQHAHTPLHGGWLRSTLYSAVGEHQKAVELQKEALAMHRRLDLTTHSTEGADVDDYLASVLADMEGDGLGETGAGDSGGEAEAASDGEAAGGPSGAGSGGGGGGAGGAGDDDKAGLAVSLGNLAATYDVLKRYHEAVKLKEEAVRSPRV